MRFDKKGQQQQINVTYTTLKEIVLEYQKVIIKKLDCPVFSAVKWNVLKANSTTPKHMDLDHLVLKFLSIKRYLNFEIFYRRPRVSR